MTRWLHVAETLILVHLGRVGVQFGICREVDHFKLWRESGLVLTKTFFQALAVRVELIVLVQLDFEHTFEFTRASDSTIGSTTKSGDGAIEVMDLLLGTSKLVLKRTVTTEEMIVLIQDPVVHALSDHDELSDLVDGLGLLGRR